MVLAQLPGQLVEYFISKDMMPNKAKSNAKGAGVYKRPRANQQLDMYTMQCKDKLIDACVEEGMDRDDVEACIHRGIWQDDVDLVRLELHNTDEHPLKIMGINKP